jgi:tetratricopeptide (TPR) repeat protein
MWAAWRGRLGRFLRSRVAAGGIIAANIRIPGCCGRIRAARHDADGRAMVVRWMRRAAGCVDMFGGLRSIRFKAAERALKEGRLDDVLRMAREPEIAAHARGGALLADLAEAFWLRAREHYRAERFTEALLDLGKADQCGADEDRVAQLRQQITVVAQEVARQDADRRRRVEQAQRYIENGSLAAGRQLIASVADGDVEMARIRQDIQAREQRAVDLLRQAEGLYRGGRVAAAVERLERALRLDAHNEAAMRLELEICAAVVAEARAALTAGRIARAKTELDALGSLAKHHDARAEMEELLRHATEAARALHDGRYDDARERARRLQQQAPKLAWLKSAIADLDRVDTALLNLRSGPLGAGMSQMGAPRRAQTDQPVDLRETVAIPRGPRTDPPGGRLPARMLLMVDGGGSYLVLRQDRVSIGRAATRQPADLPIFSDLSEQHAHLLRVEEDYFVMGAQEIEVAGRRVRQQLLRDGDRVVLGRRAKFTFRLPRRKSASARLDLSDSTKAPNDVRRVVLFSGTATLSRGPHGHVTCPGATRDLVLFERGGRLFVRVEGRGGASAVAIEFGAPVELEGASFVLQPWPEAVPGYSRFA